MTNIVVLIKQVPDYESERKLNDGDFTLDRESADAVLDEINERAVEAALQIKEKEEAAGGAGTVTVLTVGPERATATGPRLPRPAGGHGGRPSHDDPVHAQGQGRGVRRRLPDR